MVDSNLLKIKSYKELKKMIKAGKLLATVFSELDLFIKEGLSTYEIDQFIHNLILKLNCKPAFLNYHGFPASACISINEEVVHGIPSRSRFLKSGMIVGIDIGLIHNGFYSDSAYTYIIGEVGEKTKLLVTTTREALYKGIEQFKRGNFLGDIGHAIEKHAKKHNFGIVREFVGHGIGRALHEDPQVPNYGKRKTGLPLRDGMVLAIEPMVNEETEEVYIKDDGWTVVTADGKNSAHFEHTVALIDGEPVILTEREVLY